MNEKEKIFFEESKQMIQNKPNENEKKVNIKDEKKIKDPEKTQEKEPEKKDKK